MPISIPEAACSSSTISSSAEASLPEQQSFSGIQTRSTRPSSMPCHTAGISFSSPSSIWNISPSMTILGSQFSRGIEASGHCSEMVWQSEAAVAPSQVAAEFSTQMSGRFTPSSSSAYMLSYRV